MNSRPELDPGAGRRHFRPITVLGASIAAIVLAIAALGARPIAPANRVLGIAATAQPGASDPSGAAVDERSPNAVPPDPTRPLAFSERGDVLLARTIRPPRPETLTGYVWPVRRARLTQPFGASPFGTRFVDGQRVHDGIDLGSFCGDRIVAAHDGVVLAAGRHFDAFIGWIGDLGPYTARLDEKKLWITLPIVVVIDDGNGYRSMYAHFRAIVVTAGQTVRAGQLLGYEGATGHASGCHLHYGLFSPLERGTFETDPGAVDRMLLPTEEIARIDPLLILPPPSSAGIH